jgi:prepilin-type N-terminal cleavage/methylation domain-containing protein
MLRRNERGVTLIELMVAMMLLTVAFIALAASFPYAMFGVVAGGFQTTATLLSQQSIDRARNTLYTALPSLSTPSGTSSCGGGTGTFVSVAGYDGFKRCVDVQTGTSTTTVTVVTRFTGVGGVGAGAIYDATLVTLRAR